VPFVAHGKARISARKQHRPSIYSPPASAPLCVVVRSPFFGLRLGNYGRFVLRFRL
jgi:hypothetical protein